MFVGWRQDRGKNEGNGIKDQRRWQVTNSGDRQQEELRVGEKLSDWKMEADTDRLLEKRGAGNLRCSCPQSQRRQGLCCEGGRHKKRDLEGSVGVCGSRPGRSRGVHGDTPEWYRRFSWGQRAGFVEATLNNVVISPSSNSWRPDAGTEKPVGGSEISLCSWDRRIKTEGRGWGAVHGLSQMEKELKMKGKYRIFRTIRCTFLPKFGRKRGWGGACYRPNAAYPALKPRCVLWSGVSYSLKKLR